MYCFFRKRKLILFSGIIISIVLTISSQQSYCDSIKRQRSPERIIVDLNSFELRYYDPSGELRLQSIATGGAQWCEDSDRSCQTPSGIYRVKKKYDENYRSGSYPFSCYAQQHSGEKLPCGARMPYYLEFSGKQNFGIHGGFVPREPLAHVTHSCIRIPWEKAAELSKLVSKGTRVIVLPYLPITPE